MDIDAVIAEAQNAPEQKATEVASETVVTQEAPEAEDVAEKQDAELTPEQLAKREANRKSHQNSREAKLRRELRELREFKTQAESQKAQPQAKAETGAPVKPKDSDYNNLMDFLDAKDEYRDALADWKLEQKIEGLKPKAEPTIDPRVTERNHEILQDTNEFIRRVPEYQELVAENAEFFAGMPQSLAKSIEAALFDASSPALALYTLMKEGALADLEDMSPTQIGMAIGKAEERGKQSLNPINKVTNAPAPISGVRGTSSTSKPLASKSVEELMKQFAT